MKFDDTFASRRHRYWLGVEADSGRYYASIPVVNSTIDYIEYYWIMPEQYKAFMGNETLAVDFITECRRREHDDLLVYPPGGDRGIPVGG
jgi:hypothetical protein